MCTQLSKLAKSEMQDVGIMTSLHVAMAELRYLPALSFTSHCIAIQFGQVTNLVQKRVDSPDDFAWLSQLRYYWQAIVCSQSALKAREMWTDWIVNGSAEDDTQVQKEQHIIILDFRCQRYHYITI